MLRHAEESGTAAAFERSDEGGAQEAGAEAEERARLVALNLSLAGSSRADAERELEESFPAELVARVLDRFYGDS